MDDDLPRQGERISQLHPHLHSESLKAPWFGKDPRFGRRSLGRLNLNSRAQGQDWECRTLPLSVAMILLRAAFSVLCSWCNLRRGQTTHLNGPQDCKVLVDFSYVIPIGQ